MPVETKDITPEEVAALLALEESHFVDFKSRAISPAKLTRSLSAFANADGGELYIGINETKNDQPNEWAGFADVEDANGHIQAFDALFPLGTYTDYVFLKPANNLGSILKVEVAKTPDIKKA